MTGFRFKQFEILQDRCAMKVGTDGVLLGAWASGGTRILDIGCGTGLIALMMAQRFPAAQVVGIDIDEEACGQARENVAASPFGDRIDVAHCRLQDYSGEEFDAIVSNNSRVAEMTQHCRKQAMKYDTASVLNDDFFRKILK